MILQENKSTLLQHTRARCCVWSANKQQQPRWDAYGVWTEACKLRCCKSIQSAAEKRLRLAGCSSVSSSSSNRVFSGEKSQTLWKAFQLLSWGREDSFIPAWSNIKGFVFLPAFFESYFAASESHCQTLHPWTRCASSCCFLLPSSEGLTSSGMKIPAAPASYHSLSEKPKPRGTSEIKYGLILVMYQPCVPAGSTRVHVISVTGRPGAHISGRSKASVRYATISQLMSTRNCCCRWGQNASRPPVFVVFSLIIHLSGEVLESKRCSLKDGSPRSDLVLLESVGKAGDVLEAPPTVPARGVQRTEGRSASGLL